MIPCNVFLTEEADDDLSQLSTELQTECIDMLLKLESNIHLGKPLNSKLCDCFKLYFHKAEYRIVYRKSIDGQNAIRLAEVLGIGKRDGFQIYDDIIKRLNR